MSLLIVIITTFWNIFMVSNVFQNIVLRTVFVPRKEVTGSWRKLHSEELKNLCSLQSFVRMMK
jgi:hypothetical protein